MIVAVDIGNTSVTLGLLEKGKVQKCVCCDHNDGSGIQHKKCLKALIGNKRINHSVIASVVPAQTSEWSELLKMQTGSSPLVVHHGLKLGVRITYPKPSTIGPDRLANAAGAARRYGVPVIVADFGTALTFDVVKARQGYVGGVIAPGLPLMFNYLAEKTALLPHMEAASAPQGIGKSTEEAIRIGARYGYRGMVDGILKKLLKEFRGKPPVLVATGGYAKWVVQGADHSIRVDPDLTLFGLGVIYELNAGG